MIGLQNTPCRWLDYVLRGGEAFKSFWRSILHSGRRDLLFVVGRGFDPRMPNAVATVLSLGGEGLRHCFLVEYDEGGASPSRKHDDMISANVTAVGNLFEEHGGLQTRQIRMWSDDGRRRVGSRGAAEVFVSTNDITPYTDVLVDISALPRSLYMPMLAKLLYLVDQLDGINRPNLHVVVGDNPDLDQLITAEGLSEDASYLHGFESGIEQEATADAPRVWMPILGEGMTDHFELIHNLITPDEIAPILPFPCANPRRTDDLILEYRPHLFNRVSIESTNFIYVPERNPFGVYREIRSAVIHYTDALQALGRSKFVISALSSKLLSLGALLAAYDLKQAEYPVGIAHVDSGGYTILNETLPQTSAEVLFEVWIAGEPYDLS